MNFFTPVARESMGETKKIMFAERLEQLPIYSLDDDGDIW